ncbi:hypothetical protein [Ornithinimicrobium flavum]|uniref:hypothetical protein n=1 Tax=Ornithinimicrobium flavum TaxID=1288636 RepID=UPI00106F9B65|nr:hypothetical protein [Ornithinimicrobium flavum]
MAPTIQDLRATLREMADEHPAPAPADLLTDLRAARSARRTRRFWGYGVGVAAAAAAAVVLTQGLGDGPDASLPAGDPGDPVSHGWVLTDGEPPEVADGLRLLEAEELSMEESAQVPAPDPSTPGGQRYAVLWCDAGPAPDDPAIQRPALVLDADPVSSLSPVTIPCAPRDGGAVVTPVPLPPPDGGGAFSATWEGDLPRGAEAVVAVYEESSRSDYPDQPVPDPPLTPPAVPEDSVVVDAGSPTTTVDLRDAPQGGPGALGGVHAGTATISADSTLQLWAGGPGTLRVLVDGVRVTDDGDGEGPAGWFSQDPELRDGGWQVFTPGQHRTLELPSELLPPVGQTRTVTVAVQPVMGVFPWQVAVTDVAEPAAALAPVADGEPDGGGGLPQWYLGFRHAATWELPADGSWQTLEVPAELRGEPTAWVVTCPGGDGARATGAPVASVSVDGGPIDDGLTCGDPDLALLNLEMQSVVGVEALRETDGEVQASLPRTRAGDGTGSGTGSGTVSAYIVVPFEEFDHAAAAPPPAAQERLAAVFPEDMVAERTVTQDDLVDGRATLTMAPGAQALTFTTEGVGRVRITIEGRSTLIDQISRDGWWTAWSDARTTQLVTGSLAHALEPGDEIVLEVEGYDPGSFTAELLGVDTS